MPSVSVVSTVGASFLKSFAWYGIVFITFFMGLMAMFASHQAHAGVKKVGCPLLFLQFINIMFWHKALLIGNFLEAGSC
jgi:hypothetical protein